MFSEAAAFNQDTSAWDMSCVLDMNNMFRDALVFNQDISASWKVSTTTDRRTSLQVQWHSVELRSQN